MEGDEELDLLLKEIPNLSSMNPPPNRSTNGYQFTPRLSFSNDLSPYSAPIDWTLCPTPSVHHRNEHLLQPRSIDSRFQNNTDQGLVSELDICDTLHRMRIRSEEDSNALRRFGVNAQEFPSFDSSFSNHHCNTVNRGVCNSNLGFQSSHPPYFSLIGSVAPSPTQNQYQSEIEYLLEQRNREVQLQNYLHGLVRSTQYRGNVNGNADVVEPLVSTSRSHSRMALDINPVYNTRSTTNSRGAFRACNYEDSFILHENSKNFGINRGYDCAQGGRKNSLKELQKHPNVFGKNPGMHFGGLYDNGQSLSSDCPLSLCDINSLAEMQCYIYDMAKDQKGCGFLQKVISEGTCQDVEIVFNEIIDHVVELMTNQFGHYLLQKMLEVCSEEHITQIVFMVTKEPGQLVNLSLNTHGTRVIQKLIETLETRQQASLIISALEPGFLHLIKHLNGNHVLQRCLKYFSNEDNKFIFEAAAKFCVYIATDQHGCCVLQKCIEHSIGEQREQLLTGISSNGLCIAQDPYGNYVIQYILLLKIPSANAKLMSQFEGYFVRLSTQKFSSHVVQRCLKSLEESRSRIIHELLSVSDFEKLMQDQFANYVIQTALEVTKGLLHASLVEAIRPHEKLRTSPYCKKLFSRNLLKR